MDGRVLHHISLAVGAAHNGRRFNGDSVQLFKLQTELRALFELDCERDAAVLRK